MDKYEIIGHSEQLDNILRIFFLLKLNVWQNGKTTTKSDEKH
jgi:hypothetical protein